MTVRPGSPFPLGATADAGGVNFAIFSEHATKVELCLFDSPDATTESLRVPLPARTDLVWHGYLPGVAPGQLYGYRVYGLYDLQAGRRFNPVKVVLDPYAKVIGRQPKWHASLFSFPPDDDPDGPADTRDSAAAAPLAAVIDPSFDWRGDRPPLRPWRDTVIYELHVKGFSALQPSLAPALRGTYLGVAAPASIRHLLDLGVTAVELMPVHAHADEWALIRRRMTNYWGYNTLSYFAPDARFASSASPQDAVREFKTMVRGLHDAGLEVILDVVYNHTAEGDHLGPTLSCRGIDNQTYYRLQPGRPSRYEDFTGCGNTLNMQSPRALQLVMDSLRYWVTDMHVDGFRFDLAAALAREQLAVDRLSAFFDCIQQDPVISRVKLIAEPWDVGPDGYQVGNFPTGWSEWNGRYRDAVRRFWRGDAGMLPELATRLSGSSDLYGGHGRSPRASVNFIASHDGFTLSDLVSYEQKHNDANGEDNRDGDPHNMSWNGGVEGPTTDAAVLDVRARQRRNFLLTLFVSIGVPMVSGGDEIGRTQRGNNNAYCQDSELTWTHWDAAPADMALLSFAHRLSEMRATQPALRRQTFLGGRRPGVTDVVWLRPDGLEMTAADWADGRRQALGMLLAGDAILETDDRGRRIAGDTLLIVVNAGASDATFVLPGATERRWDRLVDTADPLGTALHVRGGTDWTLVARSSAVFKQA